MGDQTISIPESVHALEETLRGLSAHPALSPISVGRMVELPCCGLQIDAEAIDCSQDGPSRVYWPPRWTCSACEHTFTVDLTGFQLVELGAWDEIDACEGRMSTVRDRDESRRPYQVERDRFGVFYSGPLEVGECIEVVAVSALTGNAAIEAMDEVFERPMSHWPRGTSDEDITRAAMRAGIAAALRGEEAS